MLPILLLLILLPAAATATPHILFTVADDLGWHDLGFRNSGIRTPHIDQLAREGVVLDNYYVMPSCAPTRSTMV